MDRIPINLTLEEVTKKAFEILSEEMKEFYVPLIAFNSNQLVCIKSKVERSLLDFLEQYVFCNALTDYISDLR